MVYPEFKGLALDELVHLFRGPADEPDEGPGTTFTYYSELAVLIREAGDEGLAFLMDERAQAEGDRLAAVLFGLSWREAEPTAPARVFVPYLAHPESFIVQEAIDSLAAIGAYAERERVLELRTHPSPYVRRAVLRYLARLFPAEARPVLRRALGEPDLRFSAVNELDDMGDVESLPLIGPLLRDPDADVRAIALWFVAHAVRELGEPSRTKWLPDMERLLDDPDEDIREQAQEFLDELSHRPGDGAPTAGAPGK